MFASSEEAEAAFYEAFSNSDLEAMMLVWAPSDEVICVHPSGPRLEGIDAVRESWAMIFSELIVRSFDLRGLMITGSDTFRLHHLEENITVPGTSFLAPPVLAANAYQRFEHGWRMIAHHACVAPTSLGDEENVEPPERKPNVLH